MHIRDGILSPEVCLATGVLAIGAVGYSLRQMRRDITGKTVPYTGMTAALIFAAQMVNFPLFFGPVSGHLIGGVLAAALLGPWAGCVALTLVLVVQAMLFADGGLMSLGANVLNMAVIGSWGGWAIYAGLRKLLGSSSAATVASAVCAAYLSVLAAAMAGAAALERVVRAAIVPNTVAPDRLRGALSLTFGLYQVTPGSSMVQVLRASPAAWARSTKASSTIGTQGWMARWPWAAATSTASPPCGSRTRKAVGISGACSCTASTVARSKQETR